MKTTILLILAGLITVASGCAQLNTENLSRDEQINLALAQLKRSDRQIEGINALVKLKATPQLIELLQDKCARTRDYAAWALGRLGVKEAIPNLAKMLNDESIDVRLSVIQSLARLGTEESVLAIIKCLKDNNKYVRERAILALST
ncbi:MAG: HEAT repeat domain-containing protein [Planctomycetes bacterium]|nr:HEAT repeat domain-containing protein [Planctomycetota bacterium]